MLPLRVALLLLAGILTPAAVRAAGEVVLWAVELDWRPAGSGGYIDTAAQAAAAWFAPEYLHALWYYTITIAAGAASVIPLIHAPTFWRLLRRFPR